MLGLTGEGDRVRSKTGWGRSASEGDLCAKTWRMQRAGWVHVFKGSILSSGSVPKHAHGHFPSTVMKVHWTDWVWWDWRHGRDSELGHTSLYGDPSGYFIVNACACTGVCVCVCVAILILALRDSTKLLITDQNTSTSVPVSTESKGIQYSTQQPH